MRSLFHLANYAPERKNSLGRLCSYPHETARSQKLLQGRCDYSIELRHNSPWDVFLTIFSDPTNIALIISGFTLVFTAIQTAIAAHQTVTNKSQLDDEDKNIEYCKKILHDSNITVNVTINNQGNIQINSYE